MEVKVNRICKKNVRIKAGDKSCIMLELISDRLLRRQL